MNDPKIAILGVVGVRHQNATDIRGQSGLEFMRAADQLTSVTLLLQFSHHGFE